MRDYARISPQFWVGQTGKKIRSFGPEATIVALYLISNPHANMLGLYYIPKIYISHETGLSVEGASEGLQRGFEGGFCAYDDVSETVFVYEMAKFQIGERLDENDNRVKNVNKTYMSLHNNPFLYDFYQKYKDKYHLKTQRGFKGASKGLRSQEQEQEQDNITIPNGIVSGKDTRPPAPDDDQSSKKRIPYKAIVDYLNEKNKSEYQPTAKATRAKIKARWNEGFVLDDFKLVIDYIVSGWSTNEKYCDFIRPITIFGTKFESYLQAAKKATVDGQGRHGQWD